jgi:membrane protein DedA with SNARE-associated domain
MSSILDWLLTIDERWLYLVVLVSSFIENMFTPFPGDTITVFGAYLAGIDKANPLWMAIAASLGGTGGFMGLFYVGKFLIKKGESRKSILGIKLDKIEIVNNYFSKYGYLVILLNRFFYGTRMVIALFAGISRLDAKKTFICSLVSSLIWSSILVYLGDTLGANWKEFSYIIGEYNKFFIVFIVVIICVFLYVRHRKKSPRRGH